ncbi:glycosyltransferase [Bradyrhizobium sp. 13971]|uniref:glycosyltransferase n=1 Tax=Bradyrhizobium elkanii TaxID=29448 RepID=UPI000A7DF76E|nr:glycosyltransferase family 4 protein [Bradyrhizobium elkanii]
MTAIPLNVVRRAKKWRDALRTERSQSKAETDATRILRAKDAVITGMKPFGGTYASVLFRMVGTKTRRLRLLPIRASTSVTLLQVKADLPADLVALVPNKSELRAWARDPAVEWKLAECISVDPQSRDDCWSKKSCLAVRALIASSTRDNELVWRTLITSDQATGGADSLTTWPLGFRPEQADPDVRRRRLMIALGLAFPTSLMAMHHIEAAGQPPTLNPPYGEEPIQDVPRPERDPAVPRRRSVLFVNPSYYNFHFLAGSLRKRGWDAVSMAIIDPNSDYAQHFHGHDWNLFEADANKQQQVLRERFQEAAERFDMFHFAGVGTLSFFPYNYDDASKNHDSIPWDVLELKRRGAKIAYSITGCHDLITQTGFEAWSPGMCPKCAWRDRPEICSDHRMSAWGWKVRQLADLICIETDPPLDFRQTAAVFREPLSFAVDPEFWRPELGRTVPVPELWLEPKADGEILIYHSVGNYEMRTRQGVNVKGTGAVVAAIDRLKAEGHPVRLLFRKDVPSVDNRWMLAQADIIVDQLNYGRYGATAREGMMLGRPVVGRVNKVEARGLPAVRAIAECPIVDASEDTIYEVLRRLVTDPGERSRIGAVSRAHAIRWWSKDVLAERYERVYDHLHEHGRPPATLE